MVIDNQIEIFEGVTMATTNLRLNWLKANYYRIAETHGRCQSEYDLAE